MQPKSGKKVKAADDDTISIYIFGMEEAKYADKAKKNGGVVNYADLTKHYGECRHELEVRPGYRKQRDVLA